MKCLRKASLAIVTTAVLSGAAVAATGSRPEVSMAVRHDTSRPMREILQTFPPAAPVNPSDPYVVPNLFPKVAGARVSQENLFNAPFYVQNAPNGNPAPTPSVSFDGLSLANGGGGIPPDTEGDVSPNEYIQWINTSWAIFNKATGAITSGPTAGNSFFAGFGGPCQNTNSGDPIALWDDRAQRWVMSQFIVGDPGGQCVAVSTTSDPLGSYHRYQFDLPEFGDYPHIGIWDDEGGTQSAYLMVTHDFNLSPQQFLGAAFIAMERDKMLAGQPAALIRFGGFVDQYGAEPAHLEGAVLAPGSACAPFVHFDAGTSEYLFWDLCMNWTTPANSTISSSPTRVAASAPFVPNFAAVPQLGSTVPLDAFGTHIMYRATTRAYPAGAPYPMSMVVNHTVLGSGTEGGIRWVHFAFSPSGAGGGGGETILADGFETPPAAPLSKSIIDQGVYAPDTDTRWMGGIAIDQSGNIGAGYSVSSATLNPKVRITGRTLGDPAGQMRDEQDCTPPTTGSQTGSFQGRGRWGDYSSMSVDPADDCTFWFTNEYYPVTSLQNWSTRICAFRFPTCGDPDFALVADSPTRVELCTASSADPTFALRIGVLGGFTASTTLSASGLPGGVTANFNPATINPTPGTSTLTLTGAAGAAAGEYAPTITATSGVETRDLGLSFGVSTAIAGVPSLTAPANAATGVKVRPTFTWAAVPGALRYRIELSTTAAFTTLVASDTVTGTSWTSTVLLNASTQYFWRVRSENYCGNSAFAAASSFTTGVPGQCPGGTSATAVFQDDFQSGANGWTTGGSGATAWAQQAAVAGTGLTTTVWRIPNNATTSDQQLSSPATITIPAGAAAAILSYDVFHSFETDGPAGCWDGGSLEIKRVADPGFTVLTNAVMFTDAYTGPISGGAPLAGRGAWCALRNGSVGRAVVDLDDYRGETVQLRFRASSDSNTTAAAPNGMAIDNLRVDSCQ
jgi:hypothetical protein